MKAKDILPLLALTFIVSIGFNYFWGPKEGNSSSDKEQIGQRCKVPSEHEVRACRPLRLDISFLEDKGVQKKTITQFDTSKARYTFSTEGASLERLEFKRNWGGKEGYLETVFPPTYLERQKRCFLVAFDDQTPFAFDLVNKTEEEDRYTLTYQAAIGNKTLRKEFIVFKDSYRIDLNISLKSEEETPAQLRVLFPSPMVPELGQKDIIDAIVLDANTKVRTEPKTVELLESYWIQPSLIGLQDRYFVHALVGDTHSFVQRAYFKEVDGDSLYAVLEGPEVSQGIWRLSFYCGPKESAAIVKVDARLEQVLNYGWLAIISRPVSKIFLDILNIFYSYCKNYGLAIIILVVLMRLLLMPFTASADQSARQRAELQKKMAYIEHKYKHDKEELLKAKAELIRKHGMPGLGSMLVLILQLPLFIALGWVLSNSIQLYMAPFLWIPDLSAPDPYYILPMTLVLGMLGQALMAHEASQRISLLVMSIVVGAFTAKLSAGLTLYIVVSTFAAVAQTALVRLFKK